MDFERKKVSQNIIGVGMQEQKRVRKKLTSFGKLLVKTIVSTLVLIVCVGSAGWYVIKNYSPDEPLFVEIDKQNAARLPLPATRKIHATLPSQVSPELANLADASSQKNGQWYGLCKKRSVQSIEDFRRTVENDPTLSVYYAGFNWEEAKIGSLKEDVLAYVAHRKGDVIGPTTKPIKLPKGDQYITDGERTARTYCCNDIDLSPSAGNESPPPPYMGESELLLPPIPVPKLSTVFHPADLPWPPDPVPPISSRTVVPEPGTIALLGLGLLVLAGIGRRSVKK